MELLLAFDQDEAGQKTTRRLLHSDIFKRADKWWAAMWKFYGKQWIKLGIRNKKGKIINERKNDKWWKKYDDEVLNYDVVDKFDSAFKRRQEALKVFYNDKNAIKMLEKKIEANKKRPKTIAKIRRSLHAISPVLSKWQAKQPRVDIEAIKEIPIGEIMPDPPKRKYPARNFYLCIFHDEKTPSFQWDKKLNKFYCFGCRERGSVIDLYMKLNGCNFKTAIRELNKM